MKRHLAIRIATLAVALSAPTFAQDVINPDGVTESDGTQIVPPNPVAKKTVDSAPAPQEQGQERGTIQIDDAACRCATRHVPSADTEYKPGVDVNGNAVAPADLAGGAPIRLPQRFAIPVSTNLARNLHLPMGLREDAVVGLITVDNGKLSFNGQPVGDEGDADLAAACRERKQPDER
jgi:hypothetical protein